MIKTFATEFGRRGIPVNGVAPEGIKSDMFTQNAWYYISSGSPEWPSQIIEQLTADHCPLGRCVEPEDRQKTQGVWAKSSIHASHHGSTT